jgi:UDP-N-acetylmuramoylalanine--D-glutamate ligase
MIMTILNSNTKVLIVGLGKSGVSSLKLLATGFAKNPQNLKTFDESQAKSPDFCDAQEALDFDPDFIVLSPGYPRSSPWIQSFLKNKGDTALVSELDLAYQALKSLPVGLSEKIIGITGTAGKSTCSALLARAIEIAGKKVFLGGNFGTPFADYALDVICGERQRVEYLVLELSSYQLETLKMGVDVGVITSFSKNHLDRYPSEKEYYAAKASLWDRVSGAFFLNSASQDLVSWFSDPFYRDDRRLWWSASRAWSGQRLLGKHNEQNLNLVADVLDHLKMPPISFDSLLQFEGLPHRLENCGFKDGILFVNDSKATTIDSVFMAVDSLRGACVGTLHLLLGGKDKELPWKELSQLSQYPFIRPWFFGECAVKAQNDSGLSGVLLKDLKEFFEKQRGHLKAGDVVLLSPGGSSLDQYNSFEERGNDFKSLMNQYILG